MRFHIVCKSMASNHIQIHCLTGLFFCSDLMLYKVKLKNKTNEKKNNVMPNSELAMFFFFGNVHRQSHAGHAYNRIVIKRLCRDAQTFIVILSFALNVRRCCFIFWIFFPSSFSLWMLRWTNSGLAKQQR